MDAEAAAYEYVDEDVGPLSRPPNTSSQGTTQALPAGAVEGGVVDGVAQDPLTRKPVRAPRVPRPKVTMELLLKDEGLPALYTTVAKEFRRVYRGSGHEASDLRKLLQLVGSWQKRLFPYAGLDKFAYDVERLGATAKLKHELNQLRDNALELARKEDEPAPAAGGTPVAATVPDAEPAASDPHGSHAAASAPGRSSTAAFGTGGEVDVDDDELLELAAASQPASQLGASTSQRAASTSQPTASAHGHVSTAAAAHAAAVDDDELLAMAEEQEDMIAGMPNEDEEAMLDEWGM